MSGSRSSAVKRPADTRLALLRAAESLFAERGVDSVSMREIAAAAGQANHSAALYHFNDKRDLINSLLSRHSDPIQAAWLVTLDHMSAQGHESLPELVGLLVRPVVAKLDDPDGGTHFLLVVAGLIASRSFPVASMPVVDAPGVIELRTRIMRQIDSIPPQFQQLRMMRVINVLYGSIANYHSLVSNGFGISREGFVEDLITALVAVIGYKGPLDARDGR
ncbi:MAG: TetR/AcrR family transcriptional regulator [Candidatus Binatia bacterium]